MSSLRDVFALSARFFGVFPNGIYC